MDNTQDSNKPSMPATTAAAPTTPSNLQKDQYEKLEEMVKAQNERQGVSDRASQMAGLLTSPDAGKNWYG
jgi:hypothetical protein